MNDIKLWCQKIEDNLSEEKKIVLIGGASSSGKSFSAEVLKNEIEKHNKKVLYFSADMYYKGIARIITEKTFLHNPEFMAFKDKVVEITNLVRSIIKETPFPSKLDDENLSRIKNTLKNIIPLQNENFANKLKNEFKSINFDEPFALDFSRLNKDIQKLIKGESIIIPEYSFRTGECDFFEKNKKYGSEYDIIIIEGLYVLRDEILSKVNKNKVITSAIDCDIKTLLARRFNRDIKSDRCTSTPEQTIVSFLSQVMPAFYEYIHPTFSKAEITLNTSLTDCEIAKKEKNFQIKFESNKEILELLKMTNTSLLSVEHQKDYFLEENAKNGKEQITLRIREKNHLASKLSIKIATKKIERAIEEYDLTSLSLENRNIENLLKKFQQSGYETCQVISKKRYNYEINNTKIKVDDIENLGVFVEFENTSIYKIKQLKDLLFLQKPIAKSYYDLYIQNIPNLKHKECELKFKIINFDKNALKNKQKHEIKQYYLDFSDKYVKNCITKTTNFSLDLAEISEARIRIIDNTTAFLTLKSNGLKIRDELEKELPITFATDLIKHSKSMVEKTRYKLFSNKNILAEIDFYKDSPLTILEVEFDNNINSEIQIKALAKNLIGEHGTLEDVTQNKYYKNVNLAKYIIK